MAVPDVDAVPLSKDGEDELAHCALKLVGDVEELNWSVRVSSVGALEEAFEQGERIVQVLWG